MNFEDTSFKFDYLKIQGVPSLFIIHYSLFFVLYIAFSF
jgi:hypothetical protein